MLHFAKHVRIQYFTLNGTNIKSFLAQTTYNWEIKVSIKYALFRIYIYKVFILARAFNRLTENCTFAQHKSECKYFTL